MKAKLLALELLDCCSHCELQSNDNGNPFFNCTSDKTIGNFEEIGFDDRCTREDESDCPFSEKRVKNEDSEFRGRTGAVK